MNTPITIVIADDHPIFREGIIRIVEQDKSMVVLGTAGNGNEAYDLIRSHKPDVAILDVSMPGLTGLEVVRKLKMKKNTTAFIILTMYKDENYITEALSLGVSGYILKDSISRDIVDAIYSAKLGIVYITPLVGDAELSSLFQVTDALLKKLDSLTLTEKQILKALAQNKTSQQIAVEMFISIRTVQNHRMNATGKLNLSGHHKLLEFALANKNLLS